MAAVVAPPSPAPAAPAPAAPRPDHRPRVAWHEIAAMAVPAWPRVPPPLPPMCCPGCVRTAACEAWRLTRRLLAAVVETELGRETTPRRPRGWFRRETREPWPALPDVVVDAHDAVTACAAARAAASWCADAAAGQRDADWRDPAAEAVVDCLWAAAAALVRLSEMFAAGAEGRWPRADALHLADYVCHALTDLALSPWHL